MKYKILTESELYSAINYLKTQRRFPVIVHCTSHSDTVYAFLKKHLTDYQIDYYVLVYTNQEFQNRYEKIMQSRVKEGLII